MSGKKRKRGRTIERDATRKTWRPWLAGIIATVLAAVIGGFVTWVAPEIFDDSAAKDAVRDAVGDDGDLRYTVKHTQDGYDLLLPTGVELTAEQKSFLDKWSLDYRDPGGYSLQRLINDLRKAGGAAPNELMLSLTLEGRRNQDIHVDNIGPVNIRHHRVFSGTFLNVPPQGEGDTVKMMLDFDEVEPQARTAVDDSVNGGYKPGGLYFQEHTLTIEDAKQDTISIRSFATKWAVTFDIQIDYRIGEERKSLTIDNDGSPFALSPMNCTVRSQPNPQPEGGLTGGRASYERIWSLRGDFQGIDPVQNPGQYEIGYPYC